MSVLVQRVDAEPPLAPAAALVAKASRLLLLAVCAGPIAAFPIGLAYKGYTHFLGTKASAGAQPMATDALQPAKGPSAAVLRTTALADSRRLHCRLYFGCTPTQKASVESARD